MKRSLAVPGKDEGSKVPRRISTRSGGVGGGSSASKGASGSSGPSQSLIDATFEAMHKEALAAAKPKFMVKGDPFMEQFQVRQKKTSRQKATTAAQLYKEMDKYFSKVTETPVTPIDPRKYKQRPDISHMRTGVRRDLKAVEEAKTVTKEVKFAGQVVTVEEKAGAASKRSKKDQVPELGGKMNAVNAFLKSGEAKPTLSTVEKSNADWNVYKKDNNLEDELKRNKGYLDKKAFLNKADAQQHAQDIERRRILREKEELAFKKAQANRGR